jgi:tRNA(Arg) A34 adenosine deaminase TadA
MSDEAFMQLAIQNAREAIKAGQLPIGCVLARDGKLVLSAHNTVWRDTDPTAHAEMNAVRQAARMLGTIALSGCSIFVTLEPCPMCLSACHWAQLDRIVYGAPIAAAVKAGFNELTIPATDMVKRGGSNLKVEPYLPAHEACLSLFAEWQAAGLSKPY